MRKRSSWNFSSICILALSIILGNVNVNAKVLGGTAESTDLKTPFIVLIVVDTLRADHFEGYYGQDGYVSPLKDLISDSVMFTHAYTHAPWTRPAVASLLTSLLPSSHGVIRGSKMKGGADQLTDEVLTLPEYLESRGYYSAGFVANPQLSPDFGFSQGFDEYYYSESPSTSNLMKWLEKKIGIYNKSDFYEDAGSLTTKVIKWMSGNASKPFFLYVHYMDPHRPYFCQPGEKWSKTATTYEDIMLKIKKDDYMKCYEREVEYVEQSIQNITGRMKEMGIYDKSLIIITADHGEEFLEHGGWDHGHSLYDELLRVPLLMKLPLLHLGSIYEFKVGLIDVFPTVLKIAGVEVPDGLQGSVLISTAGDIYRLERDIFAERMPSENGDIALISGSWKLIISRSNMNGTAHKMLFNISDDPMERNNLMGAQNNIVSMLQEKLKKITKFAGSHSYKSHKVMISNSVKKRLKALGYLK